jgi:hypothetical protein
MAKELSRQFSKQVQMVSNTPEKKFYVFSHQGNIDLNYIEILFYHSQNDGHQKKKKKELLATMQGRNPYILFVGI